jgi:hypothetical protein
VSLSAAGERPPVRWPRAVRTGLLTSVGPFRKESLELKKLVRVSGRLHCGGVGNSIGVVDGTVAVRWSPESCLDRSSRTDVFTARGGSREEGMGVTSNSHIGWGVDVQYISSPNKRLELTEGTGDESGLARNS